MDFTFTAGAQKVIQAACLALQLFIPVFGHLSLEQNTAIATFLSAVQLIFGIRGHSLTPDGEKIKPG